MSSTEPTVRPPAGFEWLMQPGQQQGEDQADDDDGNHGPLVDGRGDAAERRPVSFRRPEPPTRIHPDAVGSAEDTDTTSSNYPDHYEMYNPHRDRGFDPGPAEGLVAEDTTSGSGDAAAYHQQDLRRISGQTSPEKVVLLRRPPKNSVEGGPPVPVEFTSEETIEPPDHHVRQQASPDRTRTTGVSRPRQASQGKGGAKSLSPKKRGRVQPSSARRSSRELSTTSRSVSGTRSSRRRSSFEGERPRSAGAGGSGGAVVSGRGSSRRSSQENLPPNYLSPRGQYSHTRLQVDPSPRPDKYGRSGSPGARRADPRAGGAGDRGPAMDAVHRMVKLRGAMLADGTGGRGGGGPPITGVRVVPRGQGVRMVPASEGREGEERTRRTGREQRTGSGEGDYYTGVDEEDIVYVEQAGYYAEFAGLKEGFEDYEAAEAGNNYEDHPYHAGSERYAPAFAQHQQELADQHADHERMMQRVVLLQQARVQQQTQVLQDRQKKAEKLKKSGEERKREKLLQERRKMVERGMLPGSPGPEQDRRGVLQEDYGSGRVEVQDRVLERGEDPYGVYRGAGGAAARRSVDGDPADVQDDAVIGSYGGEGFAGADNYSPERPEFYAARGQPLSADDYYLLQEGPLEVEDSAFYATAVGGAQEPSSPSPPPNSLLHASHSHAQRYHPNARPGARASARTGPSSAPATARRSSRLDANSSSILQDIPPSSWGQSQRSARTTTAPALSARRAGPAGGQPRAGKGAEAKRAARWDLVRGKVGGTGGKAGGSRSRGAGESQSVGGKGKAAKGRAAGRDAPDFGSMDYSGFPEDVEVIF